MRVAHVRVVEQIAVELRGGLADLAIGIHHGRFLEFRRQPTQGLGYLDAITLSGRCDAVVGRGGLEFRLAFLEELQQIFGFFLAEEREHV